jgi:anaerobic magnesium-protoporphyrin IX monomethyl ester cyclase
MPTVALVQPPTCDPTAPYLAVPMLTGFLRANGVTVVPIDANVEAFDALLEPTPLASLRDRIEDRLRRLDRRPSLAHAEQLELSALVRARGDAHAVPDGIRQAKNVLRDEALFFEPGAYASAVDTIDAALRVVSAAHHPLHLDFTAYRTPFGLSSMEEIARSCDAAEDPFHDWIQTTLIPRLSQARPSVIGLSVCFPGQLQPAYAFAHAIKRALPDVHLTWGGPGVTQMLLRLSGHRLARALGPFDSACLFEGENTLLDLVRTIDEGRSLRELGNVVIRDKLMGARWTSRHGMEDLRALPAPDFEGLPLDRYLAPRLVLPYDPTRGCYWGKCTFCHYGLAEVGTAAYRERDVAIAVEHLRGMSAKYGTRHFYFSQDSVAPKTIVKLAKAIADAGLSIRWATDLKPEKYLTAERAEVLRAGGAVACALGVESGSPRVLELIDKGAPIEVVANVVERLNDAGIAAEAMCFTDFPTETHDEACATLDFLADHRARLGVYIVGEFGLTHGSLVAQSPEKFDIQETWELEGDELGLGIFFAPESPWKTDDERADIDDRLAELSSGWALRPYPWAGAVSTAHTVLYYDRFGSSAFRDLAERGVEAQIYGTKSFEGELAYDPAVAERADARNAAIWMELVTEQRRIGRKPYDALASGAPRLKRSAKGVRLVFTAGEPPVPVRPQRSGRRPSHAPNAARHAPR